MIDESVQPAGDFFCWKCEYTLGGIRHTNYPLCTVSPLEENVREILIEQVTEAIGRINPVWLCPTDISTQAILPDEYCRMVAIA